MNTTSQKLTLEEMDDVEEVAALLKKLSQKEKERILYMIQGVALVSEAVKESTEKRGA